MKVALENSFPMPGSAEVAWEFLQNLEGVARCMPGATITGRLPEGGYKGTVTVRVGPATMSFRGEIDVRDIDPAARSLRLLGKGTDSTGTSGASLDLTARIEAVTDALSNLVGKSEVAMSGKAAAFGGRMMNSVADQIMKQFADNFAKEVAARAGQRTGGDATAPVASSAPAAPAARAAPSAPSAPRAPAASTEVVAATAGNKPAAGPSPAPPAARHELNVLALLWAVFKDWLRGLFRKKSA